MNTANSPLAPWEAKCRKIVKDQNWHAISFERVTKPHAGVNVYGAVCPVFEVGPKKGQPNYNRADKKTERTIFLPGV